MWHRIRQVLHALTARMTSQDYTFTAIYLNPKELQAFEAMDTNSQKHCILVAKTCLELLQDYPKGQIKVTTLVRAALLHDIGKVRGDLGTLDRVIVVMVDRLFPNVGAALSAESRHRNSTGLRHAFYIYHNHPSLGVETAIAIGVEREICQLIADHHSSPYTGEPLELTILRQADNLH
ncbi:MAG TPA: HD domain-containing protein [Bacillota bacterium]|nr:HD domain-containing protein [Bacillota bacterium]